jgi:geranylgeranyl diphosphate synthase type I
MASGTIGEGTAKALEYMSARKPAIAAALRAIAEKRGSALQGRIEGGRGLMERILELSLRGKMIRGCLVFLGRDLGADDPEKGGPTPPLAADVLAIAAAMELFQTGLLVHDDIMDRDTVRRGLPSIHASYSIELKEAGIAESGHAGEALGICAGDACYFEAFAALSRALAGKPRGGEIQALCAEILSEVVVAQMADVRWGASKAEPSESDILAMYTCKTARYSFSLPLVAGALAAGADGLAGPLTKLGEGLGLLFQLRDDELGIFGREASTGKGVGSDLREGKKTLFRARLLAAAPREERPRLASLFGGGAAAEAEDIAYIRGLADELGVSSSIRDLSLRTQEEALAVLRALPRPRPETTRILESLVRYVTGRDS